MGSTDSQVQVTQKVNLTPNAMATGPGLLHATSGSRAASNVYSLLLPLPHTLWAGVLSWPVTMFFEASQFILKVKVSELTYAYIIHVKLAILRLFKTF